MVAVVDSSVMLTGTETAHWLYNIAPVQCYRGTHYNTTPFPQFNDAPRTQDFDLEKTLTGFIKVNAVVLGGAAVAGFVMGGPAGAGAAVLKTMLVITPATASVAVGDIISGEASSLGAYILAAAEAATIYALTLGIETGIMKLMLRSNNPAMFYAGSILGAGASGFAVDVFTQFMTQNGEVDWERALKVGLFSMAVEGALLTVKYGMLGHENPVITAQKQQNSNISFDPDLYKPDKTLKNIEITNANNEPLGELDIVDLTNGVFCEDKTASGLYKNINPKTGKPWQTEQQWADKHIWGKTNDRINNIGKASGTKLPGNVELPSGVEVPSLEDIRSIDTFVFRIEGDTPELRDAVANSIAQLEEAHPEYKYYAIFGVEDVEKKF